MRNRIQSLNFSSTSGLCPNNVPPQSFQKKLNTNNQHKPSQKQRTSAYSCSHHIIRFVNWQKQTQTQTTIAKTAKKTQFKGRTTTSIQIGANFLFYKNGYEYMISNHNTNSNSSSISRNKN